MLRKIKNLLTKMLLHATFKLEIRDNNQKHVINYKDLNIFQNITLL